MTQDINWGLETRNLVKKINVDLNNVNDKFKFIFISDCLAGILVSGEHFNYYINNFAAHIIDKKDRNFFCRCSYSGNMASLAQVVNEFIYPSILDKNGHVGFDSKEEKDIKLSILTYICEYNNKYNITNMQNKLNHYIELLFQIERESLFGKKHHKVNNFTYYDLLRLNSEQTIFEVDSSLSKNGLLSTIEFLSLNYDTDPSNLKKFIQKQLSTKNNKFRIKS